MIYKKRRTRFGAPTARAGGRSPDSGARELAPARPRPLDESASRTRGVELVVFAGLEELAGAYMAAAWFGMLAAPEKARAVLGARRIPVRIPAQVASAMEESEVDLKAVVTRPLTAALLESADLIVTLGGTFERGFLATAAPLHREHWMVESEPASGHGPDRARSLRDLIRSRVAMLVFTEGWGRTDISREAARVTRPRWHGEAGI